MQYLVNVRGEVADIQNKTYVVNSSSEENAQVLAAQAFCKEFSADPDFVHAAPQRRTHKSIAAFLFMLIPIFLSFINWKSGHDTISISPDYLSCLYAVLFYTAFVVRFKGVYRTVGSWIDISLAAFVILLLSSFIKTIFVTKTFNLLGIVNIDINTNVVLPVAIVLSWLGLKIVSLTCMAGISVIALFNIAGLSEAMGSICGPLYVVCSFVGIILYLSVEPAFSESIQHIRHAAIKGIGHISNDVTLSKHQFAGIKVSTQNMIKSIKRAKNTGSSGDDTSK